MTVVFVPRERRANETRVAVTPETAGKLIKLGAEVTVESGAGDGSWFSDQEYVDAGARIVTTDDGWATADVALKVGPAETTEIDALKQGAVLIGLLDPHTYRDRIDELAARGASALSMELVPRITRAQSMDALSSQASIGGYKAALIAASRLGRYFPLMMTAAGTVRPAKVVVLGGGVAGLQALATAKRLGAIVEVSDIRPAVKEQVESLGGRFIEPPPDENESGEGAGGYAREVTQDYLDRQREELARHIAAADVVLCTAQVPGKKAPRLVDTAMVHSMKPGGLIVDLAAEQGGNCELTRAGEEVVEHGVLILGPVNTPATVPRDASTLYARNVFALFELIFKDGSVTLDLEDEIIRGALVTHDGRVVHPALGSEGA